MAKWICGASLVMISTASWADAQSELLASFVNLRSAVQNSLNAANQGCAAGRQKDCQSALIDTARLGTIDAEIALNRLRSTVRNQEAGEKIHRALRNLDDAETDINRAEEALDGDK
jgi:hypothetical protein